MRWRNREALGTTVLFVPGFLVYLVMMILPILLCLVYSFFDWDGIRENMNFVGLENFAKAIGDRSFINALKITAFQTVPGTLLVNALGILFAVLVNRRGGLTNVYRAIFFFPMLVSAVAIGFIWKSLLTYSGIVNSLITRLGWEAIDFIGSPRIAPWSLLLVNVWYDTGFATVLYLAGLQAISPELYDSAEIDGASGWQRFRRITFPWLAPAFTSSVIFTFTGYMRLYDMPMVLTSGGPAGATETVALLVIRIGFTQNRLSYGSSLAIYMLIIISIFAVSLTWWLRTREEKLIL